MLPIHEISAAPHMPYALRTSSADIFFAAFTGKDNGLSAELDDEILVALSPAS